MVNANTVQHRKNIIKRSPKWNQNTKKLEQIVSNIDRLKGYNDYKDAVEPRSAWK